MSFSGSLEDDQSTAGHGRPGEGGAPSGGPSGGMPADDGEGTSANEPNDWGSDYNNDDMIQDDDDANWDTLAWVAVLVIFVLAVVLVSLKVKLARERQWESTDVIDEPSRSPGAFRRRKSPKCSRVSIEPGPAVPQQPGSPPVPEMYTRFYTSPSMQARSLSRTMSPPSTVNVPPRRNSTGSGRSAAMSRELMMRRYLAETARREDGHDPSSSRNIRSDRSRSGAAASTGPVATAANDALPPLFSARGAPIALPVCVPEQAQVCVTGSLSARADGTGFRFAQAAPVVHATPVAPAIMIVSEIQQDAYEMV